MSSRLYTVRIVFKSGQETVVPNVIEFVSGFAFLFLRVEDKKIVENLSFERKYIQTVYRKLWPDQDWLRVIMKSPKF